MLSAVGFFPVGSMGFGFGLGFRVFGVWGFKVFRV